ECVTLDCVLNAGDDVELGVIGDPLFSLALVPFRGNAKLAIGVLTALIYASLCAATFRLARASGLTADGYTVGLSLAMTLAILPVTLSTHLLRQCLATSVLMLIYTSTSPTR